MDKAIKTKTKAKHGARGAKVVVVDRKPSIALGVGIAAAAAGIIAAVVSRSRKPAASRAAALPTRAAPPRASLPMTDSAMPAGDGPIVGAIYDEVDVDMPSIALGTPVLATAPRVYTGTKRPDMAVSSEPGNDERPAEQPGAARNTRDEGERIGSMVDA